MAKLSQKELDALKRQANVTAPRGETFVGCRPAVFVPKHLRRAGVRREGKRLCREYQG
jgi:hypothetical protein